MSPGLVSKSNCNIKPRLPFVQVLLGAHCLTQQKQCVFNLFFQGAEKWQEIVSKNKKRRRRGVQVGLGPTPHKVHSTCERSAQPGGTL
jgi:hypothetical protein